ncbi:NYN domain-containing protein [Derxia gummosa]|uniref:NYN domain-containing protein n=1 Tax=Derxia gummosa DSM 723 TaxID=1121388 RepID=A0A8B6X167_9BURK|nr:NYN domain-containing protein [Derxia gummosa]
MPVANQKLTKIGVFYDGNFLLHVSNYYQYVHARHSRLSIAGMHEFMKQKVAAADGIDVRYAQIVDAHYFRGRLRAQDAAERDVLLKERLFDDVLMRQGVTTHYLPLGANGEKGIDVWLALEAYELAIFKRYDVVALVACDGDYLPLVRKLNTLGIRVLLMAWDFKFTDQHGNERETRTAQSLIEEVTLPFLMHQVIDDRFTRNDPLINGLFVPPAEARVRVQSDDVQPTAAPTVAALPSPAVPVDPDSDEVLEGKIQNLKEGFGFITPFNGGTNLFFFHNSVVNAEFATLKIGDHVEYRLGTNDKGACAIDVKLITDFEE